MYQALENKALELLEENVNYDEAELGCNWGMEELKDFLKSHLKEAYEAGVDKTIERFATGELLKSDDAQKFYDLAYEAGKEEERNTPITKEWYDHLFGEACQQAIAEERERLKKWAEKNHTTYWDEKNIRLDDLLQELI